MRNLGILVVAGLIGAGGMALAQEPPSEPLKGTLGPDYDGPAADAKDLIARPPMNLLRRIEPELHASRDWDDAFNAGDVEALMRLYAEDATLLPPDTPPLEGGAKALKVILKHMIEKGLKDHKTTVKHSVMIGNVNVAHGTWEVTDPNSGKTFRGHWTKVMMPADASDPGRWQIVSHAWNNVDGTVSTTLAGPHPAVLKAITKEEMQKVLGQAVPPPPKIDDKLTAEELRKRLERGLMSEGEELGRKSLDRN
jgi:ketosteroid isomerase-like protein